MWTKIVKKVCNQMKRFNGGHCGGDTGGHCG